MTEILYRAMNIAERIRNMQELSTVSTILFGIILVFGVMNCILGYRLLRFWMMLFGFAIGAGLGFFGVYQSGAAEKSVYIVAMVAAGVALAVVAFLIFNAGIFIIGAGLGLTISIYLLHPTTSFTFFLCILIGVGIGVVAIRYEREVIIVGTSLLGGVLAGMALAKLGGLSEVPYGIGMSAGFAILSMLIQFAINKPKYIDDDDEYGDEADDDRYGDEYAQKDSETSGYAEDRNSRRRRKEYSYDDDLTDYELYADEDEIIEEYLDDYYGEDKKRRKTEPAVKRGTGKKRKKTSGTRAGAQKTKKSASARPEIQKARRMSSEDFEETD